MELNLENTSLIVFGFALASLRLYFEIMAHYVTQENKIGHFWHQVLRVSGRIWGEKRSQNIHFFGLVMSIGHIILFLPQVFFS